MWHASRRVQCRLASPDPCCQAPVVAVGAHRLQIFEQHARRPAAYHLYQGRAQSRVLCGNKPLTNLLELATEMWTDLRMSGGLIQVV